MIKRVEINQVFVSQNTGLSGAFTKAVVIVDGSKVICFFGLWTVDIGQQRPQLLDHHGPRSMSATAFEAEPEASQLFIPCGHAHHWSHLLRLCAPTRPPRPS